MPNYQSAVYGLARAHQDANAEDRRQGAYDRETALAPLRKQSLELGIQEQQSAIKRRERLAPEEDATARLNRRIAEMKLEDATKLRTDMTTAEKHKEVIGRSLGQFQMDLDPQKPWDTITKLGLANPGGTVKRQGDSIIIYDKDGNNKMEFRSQPGATADQQYQYFIMAKKDPMADLEAKQKHQREVEVKQAGKVGTGAAGAKKITASKSRLGSVLNNQLKTSSKSGSLIAGYEEKEVGHLRAAIDAKAVASIDAGIEAEPAAKKAIDEVVIPYRRHEGAAVKLAKKMSERARGTQLRMSDVITNAANGDKDSEALLKELRAVGKLDKRILQYLVTEKLKFRMD